MSTRRRLDGAGQGAEAAALPAPEQGLEMRTSCERCGAELRADGEAVICSYECTFCAACGETLEHTCPNCGGELVPRPRRAVA